MVDDDRPVGGARPEDTGGRYYGPFGPPPPASGPDDDTRPIGIGSWQQGDEAPERTAPPVRQAAVGPTYAYPPPPDVPTLPPRTPDYPPPSGRPATTRSGSRTLALVLAVALVALVVGGAAGFGGARLAQQSAPTVDPAPSASGPAASSSPAPLPSSTPITPAPNQMDTVSVAKATLPSTVMIKVGNSIGSGFVLDTAGHVMTNNHVVASAADGGRITVVFSDGKRRSATIVGRSPSYDLAVIKVARPGSAKPMALGNSDSTQVGQSVLAVGAPLGLPGTVTQGIVSATNRPVVVSGGEEADAPTAYINGIQTDAPINPGNSGGPLIDAGARVIGVNSAILTLGGSREQSGNIGLGFAIPIKQALQIGQLLIKDGKATYPVIGANVGEPNARGVQLISVESGGPAAKAGLRVNDRVSSIDGQAVTTTEELIVAVRTHRPGQSITVAYERGGAQRSTKVTLGSREG